ncbi:uncharacterized protein LOC122257355 [Penaeus japonicus]|uniref:uncharacterized protein LOC122257355 n=1 Tax=Penaeus japonicus TaxID=27405 RepID=UPI001C70C628|nr:uncharacterized protein LOC122257355 [Penaeus japonicus]
MFLFKHTVILCLFGMLYSYSDARDVRSVEPPEATVLQRHRRFMEVNEIEELGVMANKAADVIKRLSAKLKKVVDPADFPELKEPPLVDKIRTVMDTGKAFVRLIENINAAIEPFTV